MKEVSKLIEYNDLSTVRKLYPDKKIILCHGVFDLLHYGHLQHLKEAKLLGGVLIVTVTPDKYVNKGPHRPYHSAQKRLEMLLSLETIDHVALNESQTAVDVIQLLKPHYYVKGGDYKNENTDETGGITKEKKAIQMVGGEIIFTNGLQDSSTKLLNRYFSPWSKDQEKAIASLKNVISFGDVKGILDDVARMKVLVVGEPIIDSYVFCDPVGISSKSPSISAQYENREDYAGGSLAVANHLSALGCDTKIFIPSQQEAEFMELLKTQMLPTINIEHYQTKGIPTPTKIRYIANTNFQRLFELINVSNNYWKSESSNVFCDRLKALSQDYDTVILTDFGHGLFEFDVLKEISKIDTFIALNVQTNSGNFGFNPYTKHKHYDYICINISEARIAKHDRLSSPADIADNVVFEDIRQSSAVTLGGQGSLYYDKGETKFHCPAFFESIVDATGAGDAYFALTALLVKLNVQPEVIPFLGNCIAGLHAQTIGNKYPVNKVDLLRLIKSIL